jgi:NADPH:quinone reductase-like Zn-dependent oxidoreductase
MRRDCAAGDGDEPYSISEELAGATVLVTGATGYVGSLVLELLLRSTQVGAAGWLPARRSRALAAERTAC